VAEVAMLVGVSAPTIRRHIATGELRAVKLGPGRGRPIRVARSALDEWLVERGGDAGGDAA
jgi:excisionase family DNA binding protein